MLAVLEFAHGQTPAPLLLVTAFTPLYNLAERKNTVIYRLISGSIN